MIPKRILLCSDFSENSKSAREYAEGFAKAFEAELLILHVINTSSIGCPVLEPGMPVDIRAILEDIQRSVDKALQLIAEECGGLSRAVKTFSRVGPPAFEIVRFADQEDIGLIVMGTHGWTGFKHLVMGSTAENVVRTANCPVLTVRSPRDQS